MQQESKTDKSSPLRFGVMCKGMVFQRWQAAALKELREHGHHLVLLIRDARQDPEIPRINRLLKKKRNTILFTFLENRVLNPDARKGEDLGRELAGITMLNCKVECNGFSEYFNPADVGEIRNCRLDFILRFGFNIIRGDILSAARFGVWSFHHDDETMYRGGPAGFWEIYNGDPVNGAILQRLTNRLDGGVILRKGYLKTIMHSYKGNLEQLLSVTSSWPALVADELARNPMKVFAASQTNAPIFKLPGNLQMAGFIFKLMRNKIRFHFRDLLAAEDWNIGVISKPIEEVALVPGSLEKPAISWMQPGSRNIYLADPSGFIEDGKLHILAEEYSYSGQKASISEIDPDGVSAPFRVIAGENHLSYPYIIVSRGEVYCLPESYQSRRVMLYRRDPATGRFAAEKIVLDNVEAVDPTLFFHDGFWWLFYTTKKHSTTHLYIWYATEMTGEYQPHCCNPVKIDVRSSRPAGTPFIHDGDLYRPAQDCSLTYGGRVIINKIIKLTVDEFAEQPAGTVEPLPETVYNRGLHTISGIGDYTLIDGKRYLFNRRFLMNQLRKKLAKKQSNNV